MATGVKAAGDLALLRGLRKAGDENQLSRVISAVAEADTRFAGDFARVLITAARAGPHGDNAERLEPVPDELVCRRERTLYARDEGSRLGRVDLRFDGDDFTLFVENKLYADYRDRQVEDYLRALEYVDSSRKGLIAVTRAIPGYGEPAVGAYKTWLGSVRWIELYEDLRRVRITNPEVGGQWPLFLNLLRAEGDLGMTDIPPDVLLGWGNYVPGRDLVRRLLNDIQGATEEHLAAALRRRYPERTEVELYAPHLDGDVVQSMHKAWFGFQVPASASDPNPVLRVQFMNQWGLTQFSTEAWPSAALLQEPVAQHSWAAAAKLTPRFQLDENHLSYISHLYDPQEYAHAEDVPSELLNRVKADIDDIVGSGLLDTLLRPGNGLP